MRINCVVHADLHGQQIVCDTNTDVIGTTWELDIILIIMVFMSIFIVWVIYKQSIRRTVNDDTVPLLERRTTEF